MSFFCVSLRSLRGHETLVRHSPKGDGGCSSPMKAQSGAFCGHGNYDRFGLIPTGKTNPKSQTVTGPLTTCAGRTAQKPLAGAAPLICQSNRGKNLKMPKMPKSVQSELHSEFGIPSDVASLLPVCCQKCCHFSA